MASPTRDRLAAYGAVDESVSVWVLEDDTDFRRDLADLIDSAEGLRCTQAFESAEEFLAHTNDHFMPEVVLMDIGLPGMDGIEALQRIRPRAMGTAFLMITIHEDDDHIFQAICNGALGYLSKGASGQEILDAIRVVADGGAAMSSPVARRVLKMFAQLQTPHHDYGLTDREKDVLAELTKGKTQRQIAKDLHISKNTVDTHLRSIYAKLHVTTQTAAVAKAVGERLVE